MLHKDGIIGFLLCQLVVCALVARGEAIMRFPLEDFAGRPWGPELVRYQVAIPAGVSANDLTLCGPDGAAVPFQLDDLIAERGKPTRAILSFMATLSPNAKVEYTLKQQKTPALPSGVTLTKANGVLEMANAVLAVRMPATGQAFPEPQPAAKVPGPLLGFRLADGTWAGESRLASARRISGYTVRTVADGPVFKEVEIAYAIAPAGYYRVAVRVVAGQEMAFIREEFDFGTFGVGPKASACVTSDYLVINCAKGWTPDTLRGEGPVRLAGEVAKAAQAKSDQRGGEAYFGPQIPWLTLSEANVRPFEYPLDFTREHQETWIRLMSPWGDSYATVAGCFRDADWNTPNAPFVGLVPLHAGSWRRGMALEIWSTMTRQVEFRLPISARLLRWDAECGEESSPFSSGELDSRYPQTYGRREWALVLGPLKSARDLYKLRQTAGFIGLNHVKDWTAEWPADPAKAHPHVFLTGKDREVLEKTLDRHPAKAIIAPFLQDSPELAVTRARDAVKQLQAYVRLGMNGHFHSHYRQLQMVKVSLGYAELALTSPHLPAAERAELRKWLAVYSHLMADPDFNPRGAGNHLGNPTMPFNRIGGLAYSAALLPDHPQSRYWLGQLDDTLDYYLGRYIAPGGAFIEDPGYFMVTGATLYTQIALALQHAGVRDFGTDPRLQANARYALNLLTPVDSRCGFRRITGFGTSDGHATPIWMDYAAAFKGYDDQLAGEMMWAWQANGAVTQGVDFVDDMDFLFLDPTIAPRNPNLKSEMLPGMGAMLRAFVGDADHEAMVAFRAGFQMSHWEPDLGHFLFYAKGAPVVPAWLAHYKHATGVPNGLNHLNSLRFGAPDKTQMHGRCDARVSRHAFLAGADYLRGVIYYPASYSQPSPGLPSVAAPQAGVPGTPGAFTWTRQMQMLKPAAPSGPLYLVIRDSVQGEGSLPSWWHLWAPGTQAGVTVADRKVTYRQPLGTTLDVHVLAPGDGKIETVPHVNAIDAKDAMVLTRVAAPAGAGHFTVLYPYRAHEQPAKVEALSEFIVKVTHEEGTDYVFLSPAPITFDRDGVRFEGCSGAVRIGKERVRLLLAEGPGRVGYRAVIAEGLGPFEQVIPLADTAKRRTIHVPSTVAAFPMPKVNTRDQLQPGVTRTTDGDTVRYTFAFEKPGEFRDDRVSFSGLKGVIEIGPEGRRFLLAAGAGRLAAGDFFIEGDGPIDLAVTRDSVTGNTDGPMRVLLMAVPAGIAGLPDLRIDGVRWCPGNLDRAGSGWYNGSDTPRDMAIAVPAGKHTFTVTRFAYPLPWEAREAW
jgi:hypothetical protein